MKRTVVEQVPAAAETTKEVSNGVSCDLCGRTSDKYGDWATQHSEVNETEVTVTVKTSLVTTLKSNVGASYPGYGFSTVAEVDICPTCFKEKLIPWLQSQGANIQTREVDW